MGYFQKTPVLALKWYRTLKKRRSEAVVYTQVVTGLGSGNSIFAQNEASSTAFLHRPVKGERYFLYIKDGPNARFYNGLLYELDRTKPKTETSATYKVTDLMVAMPR